MATTDETATYIGDLATSPTVPADSGSTGKRYKGGAEIRKAKAIMKATFPSCTGAVTATHTELNLLDGVTATTAELNILDGVTATAAELNILDGVTATAAELNILDGVTATAAELNVLDGVTAFIDDDTMGTAAATNIPSAESVKAYVDANTSKSTYVYITDVTSRAFTGTQELGSASVTIPTSGLIVLRSLVMQLTASASGACATRFAIDVGGTTYLFGEYSDAGSKAPYQTSVGAGTTDIWFGSIQSPTVGQDGSSFAIDIAESGMATGSQTLKFEVIDGNGLYEHTLNNNVKTLRVCLEILDLT